MSKTSTPRGKKHRGSKAWMQEHVSDHWVHQAQRLGFRSRAAFKFTELIERDHLLPASIPVRGKSTAGAALGFTVVDLGAAPGSWCQVLHQRLGPAARIVAVDLLPMEPIAGVDFVQGDFREESTLQAVEKALGGRRADLVVSDLAPNISGVASADQARSVLLGEMALEFADRCLQPGGDLVVKAFQGEGFDSLQRDLRARFKKSYVRKPKASRDRSREIYLVGKGFLGGRVSREAGAPRA